MSKYEPAARATAEWWASKVFGPGVAPVADGRKDGDFTAFMAMGQTVLKDRASVSGDKRGQYVALVTTKIVHAMERVEGYAPDRVAYSILTDYGPSAELRSIDEALEISGARYPSKSMSTTYPDYVTASYGYGGGTEVVWHAEGWERPVCGQGQWDLSKPDGDRLPFKCSAPKYHPANEHVFDTPDPLCTGPAVHGRGTVCGRPEDSEYHHPEDPYMSKWAHEFQPPVEANQSS